MKTLRILVVDDDSAITELLVEYLRARGHEVSATADGPSALRALAAERPDLLLADLRMPGLDGLGLLEAARARHEGLAVVIMTGAGDVDSAVSALKRGAADFITKPFKLRELHDALLRAHGATRDTLQQVKLHGVLDLMDAARRTTPRGLTDLMRHAARVISSELDARGALVALHEPALRRWTEWLRSDAEAFARLDLDTLGQRMAERGGLVEEAASCWFGPPGGAVLAAPLHVQLTPVSRPEVLGLIAVVAREESGRPRPGLEVHAGVLGETLSRLVMASLAAGGQGPPLLGAGAGPAEHRAEVSRLIEPALRTLGCSPQERAAVDHALDALASGQPLRPLLSRPRALHERLDPEEAARAAELFLGAFERHDGHGAPRGLSGRDVPLAASLVAVGSWWALNTFSAPLRPRMTPEEARATLEGDRGRCFNPQVVSVFLRHVLPGARPGDTILPFDPEDEDEAPPPKRRSWLPGRR